jgi:hypothetical protein
VRRLTLLLGAFLALSAAAQAKPITGIVGDAASPRGSVHVAPLAHAANLPYNGGPVLHTNRAHVIFWQPSGSGLTFDPGYQQLIQTFLQNVAADSHTAGNVYGLTGQYGDGHGAAAYDSTYGGSVVATDRLPPNGCVEPPVIGPGWSVCLTDGQLQAEIEHVVRTDHLPTARPDVYFLVLPNGLGSCTDSSSTACALGGGANGYCGYHSQTNDGLVLYAVIPYNAVPGHCQSDNPRPNGSTADPALSTISHEHSELVTDPVGDAWIDSSGSENGDLCMSSYGPTLGGAGQSAFNEEIHGGHYYLQEEWSNADGDCRPRARADAVSFGATLLPGPPWRLSFSARASTPHGSIVAYQWFFGAGNVGHGRSVSHRFRRAGRHRVVLRTTNSWDNWTFYAGTVTAAGRRAGGTARAAKSG